jgi:hypothetical protein
MPRYKTHLGGGVVSFFVVLKMVEFFKNAFLPTLLELPICLGLSLLGSLFPDIDITSKMQKIFYISSVVVLISSILMLKSTTFLATSFLVVVVSFLKHRTITHQVKFYVVISFVIFAYMVYLDRDLFHYIFKFYQFFFAGIMSHIFLDFLVSKLKRL